MGQLTIAFARQTQQLQRLAALRVLGILHQPCIEADGGVVVFRVEGQPRFPQLRLQYVLSGHGTRRRMRGCCGNEATLCPVDRLGLLPPRHGTHRDSTRHWQNDTNAAEICLGLNFKLQQLGEAQ